MIVEPASELRSSLCFWLGNELPSYRILTVGCGGEALRVVSKERPTHLLIEVQLPDMSGFDLVRTIRHITPAARIALTGWYESQVILARVRSTGADGYIPNHRLHSDLIPLLKQTGIY